MESRGSIEGGDTISASLAKSSVFPPMVISMIAVGADGWFGRMLTKVADFYDTEVGGLYRAFVLDGAGPDRVSGREHRWHGGRDVSPELRYD